MLVARPKFVASPRLSDNFYQSPRISSVRTTGTASSEEVPVLFKVCSRLALRYGFDQLEELSPGGRRY